MHEKTRMRLRRSSYNKKLVNLVNDAVNLVNLCIVNDDSVVSDVTQQEVTILQVVDGF